MSGPADVPPEILDRLRPICLRLPETYEEPAWIGIRWRVRGRTFAHVYTVDADGPGCRLTFRSPGDEMDGLVASGHPYAKADWGDNVIRMELDRDVDWAEVGELLTESYLILAPKRLAALVKRPSG